MTWIHTPVSRSIVFPSKVNRINFDDIVLEYYFDIRRFFADTFFEKFEKTTTAPKMVFFDFEIDREIQGQKNIYIYYDREKNEICISRDILGNTGFIQKNIVSALGIYLLIAHEFGHAFEELWKLTMSQEEQEGFADIFSGYAFRSAYTGNNLSMEQVVGALLVYEELWTICREMEERFGTKNIHGNENVRVKNFLTGYMMTPQKFTSYIEQFTQKKEGIKSFKNLLLSILR